MQLAFLAVMLLALFCPLMIASATSTAWWRRRPIVANVVAQILLSAATVVVIVLCVSGLDRPLAGVGLSPPSWRTPPLAMALAAAVFWIIGPMLAGLPHRLGIRGFERGFVALEDIPSGLLVGAVLVVATTEEILYRGVGYNLAAEMVGVASAVVLTSAAFALAHVPLWGAGPALTIGLAGGVVFTVFYALCGDLWAITLAHIVIDLSGIVAPRLRPGRAERR